jgi:Domain of unknown function (DUF4123)
MSKQTFYHRLLNDCKFAVVDPSMAEHLPIGVSAKPMTPKAFASSAHLMPSLLEVSTLTPAQSAALLQALDDAQASQAAPPLAIFVHTEADRARYEHHWNNVQLHRSSPTQPMWLRIHDARVLHQLFRILAPAQQAQLFGPAASLTYWLGEEWLRAEKPQSTTDTGASRTWDWPRIERIGLVNRSLARAGLHSPSALNAQAARAERLMEQAAVAHGLDHPEDLVEFACRGLGCVPRFDEHPHIKALMQPQADEDDTLLADRWALIPPEVWSEVALTSASKEQGIAL